MRKQVCVLVGVLICGCGGQEVSQPQTMRLRFVPLDTHSESGGGASWTALHAFPGGPPGVMRAMAHAGLHDTFPVREEGRPKLFEVGVVEADDDRFVLDVRSEKGTQRIDLPRDSSASVQVAGSQYELSYPSVTVSSTARPTTNKAMLLVHRIP